MRGWAGPRPAGGTWWPSARGDALEEKGTQRRPRRPLDRRLEEVAKAVGGGYCRLQMPLSLALAVRGTAAGHRLGALEGGGVYPPPSNASLRTPEVGRGYEGVGPHEHRAHTSISFFSCREALHNALWQRGGGAERDGPGPCPWDAGARGGAAHAQTATRSCVHERDAVGGRAPGGVPHTPCHTGDAGAGVRACPLTITRPVLRTALPHRPRHYPPFPQRGHVAQLSGTRRLN